MANFRYVVNFRFLTLPDLPVIFHVPCQVNLSLTISLTIPQMTKLLGMTRATLIGILATLTRGEIFHLVREVHTNRRDLNLGILLIMLGQILRIGLIDAILVTILIIRRGIRIEKGMKVIGAGRVIGISLQTEISLTLGTGPKIGRGLIIGTGLVVGIGLIIGIDQKIKTNMILGTGQDIETGLIIGTGLTTLTDQIIEEEIGRQKTARVDVVMMIETPGTTRGTETGKVGAVTAIGHGGQGMRRNMEKGGTTTGHMISWRGRGHEKTVTEVTGTATDTARGSLI